LIIRDGVLWRQLTSCVVVYILIIQGLLLGFTGAQATGAGADNWPGFELCLNGDHGSPSNDVPDGQSGGDGCMFCLADANYAIPAPSFTASSRLLIISAQPLPPIGDWHLSAQIQQPGAPPRGPPLPA
jgi:hypothetical protein